MNKEAPLPDTESQTASSESGPASAVTTQRLSALTAQHVITLRWPCGTEKRYVDQLVSLAGILWCLYGLCTVVVCTHTSTCVYRQTHIVDNIKLFML